MNSACSPSFLLASALCPVLASRGQVFHHSYPCIDRTQARDFLACCVGALVGFEKGSANVFPVGTIRKSHFAAPQGERSEEGAEGRAR
jgi:hypothetical protein